MLISQYTTVRNSNHLEYHTFCTQNKGCLFKNQRLIVFFTFSPLPLFLRDDDGETLHRGIFSFNCGDGSNPGWDQILWRVQKSNGEFLSSNWWTLIYFSELFPNDSFHFHFSDNFLLSLSDSFPLLLSQNWRCVIVPASL